MTTFRRRQRLPANSTRPLGPRAAATWRSTGADPPLCEDGSQRGSYSPAHGVPATADRIPGADARGARRRPRSRVPPHVRRRVRRGARRSSGHDGSWATAVVVVLAAGIGLFGLATWRLYRLGVVARCDRPGRRPPFAERVRLRAATRSDSGGGCSPRRRCCSSSRRTSSISASARRCPASPSSDPASTRTRRFVIAVVTLAVAAVGALFRWRRDLLVARIASARQAPIRADRTRPSATGPPRETAVPSRSSAAASRSGPRPRPLPSGRLDTLTKRLA